MSGMQHGAPPGDAVIRTAAGPAAAEQADIAAAVTESAVAVARTPVLPVVIAPVEAAVDQAPRAAHAPALPVVVAPAVAVAVVPAVSLVLAPAMDRPQQDVRAARYVSVVTVGWAVIAPRCPTPLFSCSSRSFRACVVSSVSMVSPAEVVVAADRAPRAVHAPTVAADHAHGAVHVPTVVADHAHGAAHVPAVVLDHAGVADQAQGSVSHFLEAVQTAGR